MERSKHLILTVGLVVMALFAVVAGYGYVSAATSDTVVITGTPAYLDISISPSSYDFGNLDQGVDENTGNGYFTVTDTSSTVNYDLNIQSNGWNSSGSAWTWGAPGTDTGNMTASSANGGAGGSGGAGTYDIHILNGSDLLLSDNVSPSTNPTFELQWEMASTFTHGNSQNSTITLSVTAE
jgi:hypothetical protein